MATTKIATTTLAAPAVRPESDALVQLNRTQLRVALDVLITLGEQPAPDDGQTGAALDEIVALLLREFLRDGCSTQAYDILRQIPRGLAELAFHLLIKTQFPDGNADIAKLADASVLCLAGLMSAAGAHDNAQGFLREISEQRTGLALRHARWIARCRAVGCEENVVAFLPSVVMPSTTTDVLQRILIKTPFDLSAHRALARVHVGAGNFPAALDALAVALALPADSEAKLVLADDLAVIVPALLAQGRDDVINRPRVRWALAATPGVIRQAALLVRAAEASATLPFMDGDTARRAEAFFLDCAPVGAVTAKQKTGGVTGFPLRDGKPHVDVVWLEITNFCNQKCGFCPDPHREEPRSWLPLDQVKRLIDELANTVSVGSMQLNAYGEPLLHPHIAEILTYLREKALPWPTFFTSHGLTLVDKKLQQLSHNYPSGIAISLHNDSQDSYAATRSAKIGDYDTLVKRVRALLRQMAFERAPTHLRLYQMVCNGAEAKEVNIDVRNAFPSTPERLMKHVRFWERIAADIAAEAPAEAQAQAVINAGAMVENAFFKASHHGGDLLPILRWKDENGHFQQAFISTRPVGTYANLLLEYDPTWKVERQLVNRHTCSFTASPSLAIFATGRLGICCLDLNSTATFGQLSDYGSLQEALTSPEALRMFAELSNGIATSRGCQICLGTGKQVCAA